jgi:hypothetical protein
MRHRAHLRALLRREAERFLERRFRPAPTALAALVLARVIHQDLPLQVRSHTEEVRPALPIG